jgi:integrase/recombinase XerC
MANGQNTLSESQVHTLMHHLESRCLSYQDGLRDYLIVSFMLHAGLRLGETLQLSLSAVQLEGVLLESVHVDGSISKSGKSRSIPICKSLRGSLIQYLKTVKRFTWTSEGLLFPGLKSRDRHLAHRTVQKFLEKESLLCLGIAVHPHMLRHTYATRMMRLTDMRTVQELLGHASVRSTQVYTHPDQEDLKKATSKLDELNKNL